MNYILFDADVRTALLPFTYTRPVADIRIGILTIREKWEAFLNSTTSTLTEKYLNNKYPTVALEDNIVINASFLPDSALVDRITKLQEKEVVFKGETLVAFRTKNVRDTSNFDNYKQYQFDGELIQIRNIWDIFSYNDRALRADYEMITRGRESQPIPDTVQCINREHIFIEKGAKLTFATLNASTGPIYIGKDAEIMEGCMVRGPLAMCQHSVLKLGAKIYGATTIGPYSKVGGEVNNSVIFGYSNKGHDGFLGNSVIGEWCNLGADTNNSNLKNNYAAVKLWSYEAERFVNTGLQFCGLMMGDHSKCGINTMFNTGTVVGVSANIFGSGFPRNFIPSFSWGGASGYTEYQLHKVCEVAHQVMKRRNKVFDVQEQTIIEYLFEETKKYRKK